MTTFETREGVDVELELSPDTPVAWRRAAPVLGHIDNLASVLSTLDADWNITVTISGLPILTITAEPATEQGAAA